jgi:hypothetical protein
MRADKRRFSHVGWALPTKSSEPVERLAEWVEGQAVFWSAWRLGCHLFSRGASHVGWARPTNSSQDQRRIWPQRGTRSAKMVQIQDHGYPCPVILLAPSAPFCGKGIALYFERDVGQARPTNSSQHQRRIWPQRGTSRRWRSERQGAKMVQIHDGSYPCPAILLAPSAPFCGKGICLLSWMRCRVGTADQTI